jgi:Golgi SNAP receptor complex protein 1
MMHRSADGPGLGVSSPIKIDTVMGSSWEDVRKEARKLEAELDLKLISYAKFAATYTQSSLLRGEASDVEVASLADPTSHSLAIETEQLLQRLTEVNDRLARAASSELGGVASLGHHVQQHRSRLQDFTQEFKRVRSNIKSARDHADLVSTVRKDISQYKSGNRQDALLRERNSLAHTDRTLDALLTQQGEARESLHQQRTILTSALGKLEQAASVFAGLGSLLTNIRRRKSRDCIIFSAVAAVCICFLVWYAIR